MELKEKAELGIKNDKEIQDTIRDIWLTCRTLPRRTIEQLAEMSWTIGYVKGYDDVTKQWFLSMHDVDLNGARYMLRDWR